MAKKVIKSYTEESLRADANKFEHEEGFKKTDMTIDWMDAYVALIHPERIDEWVKCCVDVEPKDTKATDKNGDIIRRIDGKTIRNNFIEMFFPNMTDEAIKARKDAEKARKEAERAEKERVEQLSPEEKLRYKLEKLRKNK